MNNIKRECLVDEKLQKAVTKLISEKYFMYQLYLMSTMAVDPEQRPVISDIFGQISGKQLNSHMKSLIEWCYEYNVEIPCSDREFKKLADKNIAKQASDVKKGKDAGYYLSEAMAAEESMLESCKKILDAGVCEYPDLQSIIWNMYYDDEQSVREINSAIIAYEASYDMLIG